MTPAPAEGEPVQLSEFTVKATEDNSYVASESITGSRVATRIQDLPFSINVVTSEFLQDFDLFDLDSNLAYTSSLTGLDTQGNYNLRGFGATFQLRNGFYRLGLVDRVNVDRIEIIKGPNAAIYGQTSPAGLVNIISKRPRDQSSQRLALTAGSNDLLRGELNATGALGSIGGIGFSHVFSASAMDRDFDAKYAHLKQRSVSEAVQAKLNERSNLLVELEWSQRNSTAAVTSTPWVVTRSGNRYVYTPQVAYNLMNFNQSGPNGRQDREMFTTTLTYENRLSDVWSTRVSGYYYNRNAYNFNSSAGDQYDPVLQIITSRNPVRSDLNEDGGALQADLLAHYWLANHTIENKTLLTFDWTTNWRYRHETKPLTSIFPSSDVSVINPNYAVPDPSRFNIVTRDDHTRNDVVGVFLRQQTAMLQGRLIGFAGVRYDYVTFNLDFGDQFNVGGSRPGSLNNAGTVDHFTDSAWSPNVGVNYKLTKNLAVYANYSRSFFPNAQSSKLGDPRLPNERAHGYDYGFKGSFFSDRLAFTLGAYSIERTGVKATVIENGTAVDRAAGEQQADGVEFDFTWRATDELTLLGGYGYTDAQITNNGRDLDSIGRRPNGVPQDNGGLALKYNFRGSLHGFAVTAGVKYLGEANPNSLATVAGGAPDLARRNTVAPSSVTYDAGISYHWTQQSQRLGHTVRLSARNLFDKQYVMPNFNAGTGREIYFTYTLSH
jgi:iron complex outermembrane receptor protein